MFKSVKKESVVHIFPQQKIKRAEPNFSSEAKAFLNTNWEIEVLDGRGRQLTKMPFCYLVHTYLKDYGFNPDAQLKPSPVVCLRLSPESVAKMPLFIYTQPK